MSPTGSSKRVQFSTILIHPLFSVMKILPSLETSTAHGACNPYAIISTPFEVVRLLESDTGEGNGTKVSLGEYFMVIMLTIMTRTEGITSRISCLFSMRLH